MSDFYPKRIVCLTEETTETLYLLGEESRIVGISGFTRRPPQARKQKPIVSAFTEASLDEIESLKPDLVIGFSDIQADIARDLIKRGIEVWVLNHRSIDEILAMIIRLGVLVGQQHRALELVQGYQSRIDTISARATTFERKPKVYFEEWNEPIFTGIRWVAELIELAGGEYIFPELAQHSLGKNRIVEDPYEIVRRNPDMIFASWCGKKFDERQMRSRKRWEEIGAIRDGEIHSLSSETILQPGPGAFDALDMIAAEIERWVAERT